MIEWIRARRSVSPNYLEARDPYWEQIPEVVHSGENAGDDYLESTREYALNGSCLIAISASITGDHRQVADLVDDQQRGPAEEADLLLERIHPA